MINQRVLRIALTFGVSCVAALGASIAPNGVYVYTSLDTGLGGGPSIEVVTDLTRANSNQFAAGSAAYGNAGLGDVHTLVKARSTTDGSFVQIAQATTESQFQDTVLYQDPSRPANELLNVTATLLVSGFLYTPVSLAGNLGVTTIRYTFAAFNSEGTMTNSATGVYTQRSNGFNEGTNFIGLLPLTMTLQNYSTTTFQFVLGAGAATSANSGLADDMVAYADLSHSAHWQGITLEDGETPLPGTLTSELSVDWLATNTTQPEAPEPDTWALFGGGLLCLTLVPRTRKRL